MSFLYRINKDSVANSIACKEGDILEREIEELLHKNNELILGEKILYIGRQLKTATGKILDLLAIDSFRRLIVIELKRGYAPREILAQILEYSSWLRKLSEREIENIAKNYFEKYNIQYRNLSEAFTQFFGQEPEIRFDNEIVNVLFAQEFPPDLLNSMEYLRDTGLDIECIRFDLFGTTAEEQFLLVHKMFADEEDIKIKTEPVNRTATTQRQNLRKLTSQLTIILGEKYNSWAESLGDGLKHPFYTWQRKGGIDTCSGIQWILDRGILTLEFGIYYDEASQKMVIYSSLWILGRSTLLKENFYEASVQSILVNKLGYNKSTEDDDIWYFKDFGITELNINTISKLSIEEIERLKPLIEKILSR